MIRPRLTRYVILIFEDADGIILPAACNKRPGWNTILRIYCMAPMQDLRIVGSLNSVARSFMEMFTLIMVIVACSMVLCGQGSSMASGRNGTTQA